MLASASMAPAAPIGPARLSTADEPT